MDDNLIKDKKILITGGAGFIGSHLAEKLVDQNQIIIYDNLHRNALKYTGLIRHKNCQFIKGDILDLPKIFASVDDCDIVIHLAAIAGIENVIISPLKTLEINLMVTYNLLKAINGKSKKIKRFIFFSTSEVYGPFVYQAQEEGMTTQGTVKEQRWAYSTSKIAGEHWVYAYYKRWGLPAVILRPFNVYGERQVGESAVNKFIVRAIKNEPMEIFGSGNQIRAWCYIDDMVSGTLLALQSPKAIGQIYNIGNPAGTITILELAKKIKQLAGSKSEIVFRQRKYTDIELRIPSVKKAENDLGFSHKVNLDDGLSKTIEWFRKIRNKR